LINRIEAQLGGQNDSPWLTLPAATASTDVCVTTIENFTASTILYAASAG